MCNAEQQRDDDERRPPAEHDVRKVVPAEGHAQGRRDDGDDDDRRRQQQAIGRRDQRDEADDPSRAGGFAGNEGTVAGALSSEGTGGHEAEIAAEHVGLIGTRPTGKGLEPKVDQRKRPEQQTTEQKRQSFR
ncbi:hypothetical protein D3C87_1668410 [compost metagenome]